MHKRLLSVITGVALLLPPLSARAGWGDPVLHWNAIALQAVADDHTGTFGPSEQGGPTRTPYALAIVHAAIFDAVNSIDRRYEPYHSFVAVGNNSEASIDAAVAEAAHRTLTDLFRNQRHIFDTALHNHLSQIPDSPQKSLGQVVGRVAAMHILQMRRNDGADRNIPYVPSVLPGRHRVDPTNPMQGFFGEAWGRVRPFVLQSGAQFRAPPPPDISSPEYAEAFQEVLDYGGDGVNSPAQHRTADQKNIGLFWAYDGTKNLGTPPRLYNQIARIIAMQQGNSMVQNARFFALINLAQADAGIAAWDSKYLYDYWRPIVAIREADAGTGPTGWGDGNPWTAGDVNWTPLGAPMSNMTMNNFTPPFPAYPSGHATFGGAVFRAMERFYGTDAISFTITSDELNGVTVDNVGNPRDFAPRTFHRFSDAAKENGDSRVYLGIHWKFDATAGIDMGKSIADYTFDTILQPLGGNQPTFDLP